MDSTVYIDESGDLGCNVGTRWFVMSAVIVDKEKEPKIRQTMWEIKNKLNIQEIHLRKIPQFNKKIYIAKKLNEEDFTYLNVIVDTNKFDSSKNHSPIYIYNYVCRILLERVSWFLRDENKTADVILSARGTSRDGELIKYITEKLVPYKKNNITKGVFGKVMAKTAKTWDLLQLADVCATTTYAAYEMNQWGFRMPCFLSILKEHLYAYKGTVMKYGIKYYLEDMNPGSDYLYSAAPCKIKERIPGATSAG